MLDELLKTSVNIRLDKAKECLRDAEMTLSIGLYATAANRSYYCILHSMRAALIAVDFSSRKHSGIIAEFRQRYIKNEIFPKEFSDIIKNAFSIRNDSDYEDFYIISKEEVAQQVENAKVFLASIEEYLKTLIYEV